MGTSWLYVPEFHGFGSDQDRDEEVECFYWSLVQCCMQGCYWCSLATGSSPCCWFCCWRGWKDASHCWIDVQDLPKPESVQVQTWFRVELLHYSKVFHEARQR